MSIYNMAPPYGVPSRPLHPPRIRTVLRRIKKPRGGHLSHRPSSLLRTSVASSRNSGANVYGIPGANAATPPPLGYKYWTLALALRSYQLRFDSRSCARRWELRERNIINFIGRLTVFLLLVARPWLITSPEWLIDYFLRRAGNLCYAFAVIS